MVDNELKELERKIFLQYFEDGFWDMYIGLVLLAFGLAILLDIGSLAGVFAPLGIIFLRGGKSKITYARIGYIKFRNTNKRNITSILVGVLVFGLLIFFFLSNGQTHPFTDFLKNNMLLVIGAIWGGALALAAAFLSVKRFFLYAVLVFIAISISDLVGSLGLNLVMAGIAITVIGLLVLVQFIRKYPIIPDNEI